MNLSNEAAAKAALRGAILAAIEEIGIDALKRTSMFPLSNRQRDAEMKQAA